jgi:hypothetical protein
MILRRVQFVVLIGDKAFQMLWKLLNDGVVDHNLI